MDDNKLCGRKLVFGDLEQLGAKRRIDCITDSFLRWKNSECYDMDLGNCDECIEIDGTNIVVVDEYGYQVDALIGDLGTICPYVCGDVDPGESSPGAGDCGDADVDIFDILEEVDIALNDNADACQVGPRSDVPTGTPPYCTDPDGVVNILDIMVLIDMVLGRQDCCSYYYIGIIY